MYLKFTTEQECINCISEIDKRLGYNGNVTKRYTKPKVDIDGNFVIPKPKQSAINEIKFLARLVQVESFDENNEPILVDTLKKVNVEYDELGNDITVYVGDEQEIIKQVDLSTLFGYTEVETIKFSIPIIEEV